LTAAAAAVVNSAMEMTRRDLIQATLSLSLLPLAGCAPPPAPAAAVAEPAPSGAGAAPKAPEQPRKKAILILGGTGFLGPQLVEAAQSRGHTLTLFNRGKTKPTLFPDIEKLRGNRDGDLKALEGRKWDAVIDTSGYVPRIVKASAELLAPSVQTYVFVSTISVFGDTSKRGMDETAPVATIADPTNEEVSKNYGALKALCEKAAEAGMPGRVINVRPGLIVGPGDPTDRFTYWPVRVAKGGEILAPGSGSDPVQFIDARDLAAWIILAIEQGDKGVFNATGPDKELPISTLLDACKAASGSDASFTWAPTEFLEQQKVAPWSDMPVWVPAVGEDLGMARINCSKAIGRGLRFRPVQETARDTLEWWKTLPDERRAKLRAGLAQERELAVLGEWKKKGGGKPAKTGSSGLGGPPRQSPG
jgi:2'-hydroxyisoflavone reductase